MTVREALNRLLAPQWDGDGGPADEVAPLVEKALRAAYWEGAHDAQYAEIHPKDKYAKLDDQEGVTAGVAAMMEAAAQPDAQQGRE